jgi:hypothetical protein
MAMMLCRALPLVAALVAFPMHYAAAQFGGMPGMPGSAGPGGGFGAAPAAPPPACQALLKLRDETQKHGAAIQAANERKATVQVACRLFKTFIASEAKLIKGLEENSQVCGVPADLPKQMKTSHARIVEVGKEVCERAAQGARPVGPSLSDVLGASPNVPADNSKRGYSTFDTLTGNALTR